MAVTPEENRNPTLRQLVKYVQSACWSCKCFRASPLPVPHPRPLPTEHMHSEAAFEVIKTNFAEPIFYKLTHKPKGKPYLDLKYFLDKEIEVNRHPVGYNEDDVASFFVPANQAAS